MSICVVLQEIREDLTPMILTKPILSRSTPGSVAEGKVVLKLVLHSLRPSGHLLGRDGTHLRVGGSGSK